MSVRPRVAIALALLAAGQSQVAAADRAGAARMVEENLLPGSSPKQWDVEGTGDPTLQGFSTDISVNAGETVRFKVRTDAAAYRIDIYRVGYYGGDGARLVATIPSAQTLAIAQPECVVDVRTGLIDCGNWAVTAAWPVPDDAKSGVYVAKLVREDTGGASHVMFVVRHDLGDADILLQTSDTTWQAYNDYGGNSLYVGAPASRAYKVSYNRPMVLRGKEYRRASFWANEFPTIRWLEANGYDVEYSTGVDTARRGDLLKRHKVFMSVGHDEYWSTDQRANVEAARDAGVHLAFLSGNAVFWRTRWESSIDGAAMPWRTLVAYKETHAGAWIDAAAPHTTATWRDPRFGRLDGGGRPENGLKGSLFVANCCRFDGIVITAEQGKNRFWRHTEAARLNPGQTLLVGEGTVGYEWDGDVDNGFRPPGLVRLSATSLAIDSALLDFGSRYGPKSVTHNLTLFKHASGALVFSAGTIVWGWALDPVHDDPDARGALVDPRVQQATVNVLADMLAHPASPSPSLVVTGGSHDFTAPVASIDPALALRAAVSQLLHLPITVSGSAVDEGGVPAGVEVSVDGGASWHPAVGAESWTYELTSASGDVTVLARAVDDSGNLQPVPTHAVVRFHRDVGGVLAPVVWLALTMLLLRYGSFGSPSAGGRRRGRWA
jgi:hypothetical protein